MSKVILITGATSGLGRAIAEKFSANGWNCIITGRRKELLEEVRCDLLEKYNNEVIALNFDVSIYKDAELALAKIGQIDILVNNAGLALGSDLFQDTSIEDIETMINTNIKGLIYMSKLALPLMKNFGHIINIGSIAAKQVYQDGSIYCMTKHAVDAITRAMRIDLLKNQIKVTAIHPGRVKTEFSKVRFKGNEKNAAKVYQNYEPLQACDIAETIFYCANLPYHVCIDDLVLTPLAQADVHYIYLFKDKE